jgi:predicted dehydrogenase
LNNGTHWLDLARYLAGEVKGIQGQDRLHEESSDPTLDVELAFVNGAHGSLFGLDARHFAHFEMDLVGTAGRIRLTDFGHDLEVYEVVPSPRYRGYRELARSESRLRGDLKDILLHVVVDIVRCLEEGGQPRCTGYDGVVALEMAFAARASLLDGQPRRVGL